VIKLIENIANKTLGSLVDPTSSDHKKMSRQGEIDGRTEDPPSDSEQFGSSESEYLNNASERWRIFKNQCIFEKQRLSRDLDELQHKLSVTSRSEEDLISAEQKKEIDLLEAELGPNSDGRRVLKETYNKIDEELQNLKIALNRPLDIKFVKTYVLFMFVLAIAEVPVNQMSFELIFNSLPIVTYLLAGAVGVLFLFFAHIVGSQLKRSQCPLTSANKDKVYLSIFFILFVSGVIMYFLGVMREGLVKMDLMGSDLDIDALLQSTENQANDPGKLNFSLGQTGAFLILINFSIFLSGVLLAYFRHDANPYYEDINDKFSKAKNLLNAHTKEFERKSVEILRRFNERLNRNNQARFSLEKRIEDIRNIKLSIENEEQIYKERVINEINLSISEYRKSNKASRRTPVPTYFSGSIKAQMQEYFL
jgi:hypothetical protein